MLYNTINSIYKFVLKGNGIGMRYVTLEDAEPGMRLEYGLLDSVGRTLIGSGCEITNEYIEKLKLYGFDGIYISDELSDGIKLEPIISVKLRTKGLECVRRMDIDGCKSVATEVVAQILEKGSLSLDMTDLRSFDDYTYAHSVNVAILACVVGIGMKMQEEDLRTLVIAGLLHDLGKLSIPSEILNKPGRLSMEEYELMKSHAKLSYEFIKERWDLSAYIKNAVLYHHENVDGSGYPEGITDEELTDFAKILHVADVYDALISKRPYKDGYSPYEACEYLMGGCGIMFDREVVSTLLKYVPLYPKGTTVNLSDGRKGIIFENSGDHNLRPLIKLTNEEFLDLMDLNNLNVTIINSVGQKDNIAIESEKERLKMIRTDKKPRVLIVDDMKSNLQLLKSVLMDTYEIILVKSGKQALSYLQNNPYPDIILMDIDMPEMDGIETTKYIQQMTDKKVPILFVTAICDRETVFMCRNMNVAGYILRPFKPVYIKSEIKRILTGRSDVD